ncbi:CCA tRNA nucleotidyltransferase [Pelagibacteraceae bacterium]|nr:CCA tRNA nucleotidyltransferase [Pelagibacteraceae bacterium]
MFNLSFIQKIKNKFFPFYKNSDLKFVFIKLQEDFPAQSKTAMFVGGCVRKYLLKHKIDDIDIATSLTTDQIKEKFKNSNFKIIDSGIRHGTVTLVKGKLKLELTTLRKDIKTDGRHAEIEYTNNWLEDSKRRDFTINAIYLDKNGEIFDPQLGIEDLKKSNIKFIGDPQKRIEEDYLRIIRFVRFSLEYKCETDSKISQVVKLNLNGIKKISKERILTELLKILKTKNFIKLNDNKLLKEIFLLIFPEFKYVVRLHKLREIYNRIILEKEILLAILLIDETNNHEYFSHKYNTSTNLKEKLNLLAKNFINFKVNKNFFQNDLKKNIFYFGKEHLQKLLILNFVSNKKVKFKDYLNISNSIEKISIPLFPFDGKYLKKRGMKEGAIMGKTLVMLQNEWVNNGFKISDQRISKIIIDQK